MGDTRDVNRSLLGLMGQTVDVMMQANTRVAMEAADIVINPALEGFGSLDWRRSAELAAEGYRAAEAMKDKLLPLALDEAAWAAYRGARAGAAQVELAGAAVPVGRRAPCRRTSGASRKSWRRTSASPSTSTLLETDLETFAGLDRYETVGWQLAKRTAVRDFVSTRARRPMRRRS